MLLPWIIAAVCVVITGVSVFLCIRAIARALEFDELFELFEHDITTNVDYLRRLTNTPVFVNSPEILDAQKNFKIMLARLEEYTLRIEEVRRRPKPTKSHKPPVVI